MLSFRVQIEEVEHGLFQIGPDTERLPKGRFGFVQPVGVAECGAQVVEGLGIVGFDLQSSFQLRDRVAESTLQTERDAEPIEGLVELGIDFGCGAEVFDCGFVLPESHIRDAGLVLPLGVIRHERQSAFVLIDGGPDVSLPGEYVRVVHDRERARVIGDRDAAIAEHGDSDDQGEDGGGLGRSLSDKPRKLDECAAGTNCGFCMP